MIIQHNIMALNSYNKLATNNSAVQKNLEKLSSGYRINRAGDDAAGLAISEKMRAQITGLERAKLNAQDGISLVQTAEGALTEVHSMLNRLVELGTESANGIYQAEDRQKIQAEVNQITEEINRISDSTNFNGINLLDGSLGKKVNDSLGLADTNGVDYTDGVDIANNASTGAAAEFNLTLDKAFGDGDEITISYKVPNASGSGATKTITLSYTAGAPGNAAQFTGATKEEQLESIKDALMNAGSSSTAIRTDFGSNLENAQTDPTAGKYSVSIDSATNTLTIKANDMGKANKLEILDVTVNDANARDSLTFSTSNAGVAGTATVANYKTGMEKFLTEDTNVSLGDTVRFEFTLANGVTANVDLKITDQIYADNHTDMADNIAKALEKASFNDNTATTTDESQYKVGDFFNAHANVSVVANNTVGTGTVTGAISFTMKDTALKGAQAVGDFQLNTVQRAPLGSTSFTAFSAGTITSGNLGLDAAATAQVTDITFGTNFTIGDEVVLKGKLVDGRGFEIKMKASADGSAVNSFTAGANATASLTNLVTALNSTSTSVTITDEDGKAVGTMTGKDVFSATGAAGVTIAASDNKLTLTNRTTGVVGTKGVTGQVDVTVKAENSSATGKMVKVGEEVVKASTTVDFSDVSKLEYGMAINFGVEGNMKTFELMKDAADEATDDGNVKVVVADLENATSEDIAKAFQDALNKELTSPDGTKLSDWAEKIGVGTAGDPTPANGPATIAKGADGITNSVVKLEKAAYSDTVGDFDTKAAYGDSVTISYNKDADGKLKLKAGDTIEINGKTYQFDTDVRNVKSGNNLIKVTDFNDPDNIANAIKTALNNDDPSLAVKINDDKSVTIYDAAAKTKPTVELGSDKGGLTLQVGDTNDDFNKVTVFVEDMSSKGLGIDGLDVTEQGISGASIDKVKGAIEKVSVARGNLGALQNRLEHTINNLATTTENMTAAESRIRDTDMAKEMMNFTKNNVLVQAAQAMLAQANQQPQQVLQLLR